MVKSTLRDLDKAASWRRMIEQQATSELSVRAWCRQQGVTESAFYWWRRELTRRDTKAQVSSFLPVHVTEERLEHNDPQIDILLANGPCIRIHGSVDRQMLTDVLDVLASASSVTTEQRVC